MMKQPVMLMKTPAREKTHSGQRMMELLTLSLHGELMEVLLELAGLHVWWYSMLVQMHHLR
jgi:hypothetical protein